MQNKSVMEPKIVNIGEKKLIGMRMLMSLAENKTPQLWRSFMPRRKEISQVSGSELISMQVFDPQLDFRHFTMQTLHDKWAAVEVNNFEAVPEGMETFVLPAGLYAVFPYKGKASESAPAFQYIYGTWLPASPYMVDKRPHFEVLGAHYKNEDPDSEEDIYIPLVLKQARAQQLHL